MRTAGVWLIFAAVALRGFVVLSGEPELPSVMGLLAAYGLFLLAATWITHRKPALQQSPPRQMVGSGIPSSSICHRAAAAGCLEVRGFFRESHHPTRPGGGILLGTRLGFLCIAAFSLAMVRIFLFSNMGQLFGLAMGVLYSGLAFLFGGYAYQVQKAEASQDRNRRTFDELQAAHRQLQGYADQATSLAVEQERNRLARELHDSVTQTVFSMNLAAQSTRLLLDRDPSRAAGQLLRIEELAANAQAEIGSLVTQLRPRSATEEGLPAALRRLAAQREEQEGLQVSLEVDCERALSEVEAAGLYAIAQEALTNIARHSGAREAAVRLDLKAAVFLPGDRGSRRGLRCASGLEPARTSRPGGHG